MRQKDAGPAARDAQQQLHALVSQIRRVEALFNYETDNDMLEAHIYELQSLTCQMDRLLKLEKQKKP
jgi:hypothetical protein